MKKRSAKNESRFKRLFNKMGMTYVELICALALLSLIVMMFTPMLLSSYEQLYAAGEKVEDVYESKTELEESLARRDSALNIKLNMNLKVSTGELFENINVNGRKAVSTLQQSFETVFGQIRPSLTLLSPSHVNDDSTTHNILIQTRGLEFSKITSGEFAYTIDPSTGKSDLPAEQIHIEVIIPDKTQGGGANSDSGNTGATYEESVYSGSGGYCDVTVLDSDNSPVEPVNGVTGFSDTTNNGRISFTISNDKIDFTYSPLKIQIYYVNTRGKTRTVSEYIYIDPPTLLFAGETEEADYYTSAGVKEISEDGKDSVTGETIKNTKYTLEAEARTMRTSNSRYLTEQSSVESTISTGSPSALGVEIKNVRWIDNDETDGLDPYYILTGTGGTIYRMYNYTSDATDIYEYSTAHGYKNSSTAYYGSTTFDYIDQVYDISTGHRIYPSLWSGDFSHVFEYSSGEKRTAYGTSVINSGGDGCWLTSTDFKGLTGADVFNVFSTRAQYAYYYNADATGYDYDFKNTRQISYIITERGWPIRLLGSVGNSDSFTGFYSIWDSNAYKISGDQKVTFTDPTNVHAFNYPKSNNSETQNDYVYGMLRIKSLGSYDTTIATSDFVNYFDRENDGGSNDSYKQGKIGTVKRHFQDERDTLGGESTDINITDVIYIPSAGGVAGSTFYVGTTKAISNVMQVDRINGDYTANDNNEVKSWQYYRNHQGSIMGWPVNRCNYLVGSVTEYLIYGDLGGDGVYIASSSQTSTSNRKEDTTIEAQVEQTISPFVKSHGGNGPSESETWIVPIGDDVATRTKFFLPDRTNNGEWRYIYLPDVNFTFGYSSNRERVYTNITYDGTTEFNRSAERLYWRSHYGEDAYGESSQTAFSGTALSVHQQNRAVHNSNGTFNADASYLNSKENDYYNVWFPGEMYNLTNVASKDGVTVAVGYAVAGSAYQYSHDATGNYTSTALGSIYNDGVLSAMVEGQDSALVNLLYYKDNESFDGTSLWNKDNSTGYSQYSSYTSTSYGMHGRDSVQFTAVDIFVEEKETATAGKNQLNYWAIYGDSKGRTYMSLVATGIATVKEGTDPDDSESNFEVERDVELVSYISDTVTKASATADASVVSNMIEITTVDGYTTDVAFKKISSIEASDELVIITGVKHDGWKEIIVVGQCNNGVWTWKWHQNDEFTGDITDAVIVNGYYYFVGYEGTGHSFLGAISVDTLKEWPNAQTLIASDTAGVGTNKDEVMWVWTTTDNKINTIAGRASR